MLDSIARARKKRIAAAPRIGTPVAAARVEQMFAADRLVLMEAYFFRCGCSSDYYLLRDKAEFDAITARFHGDNPELYLYCVDELIKVRRARTLDIRGAQLRDELERMSMESLVLIRCSRAGQADRYFLTDTDDEVEGFTAQDWTDWEIDSFDVVAALEVLEPLIIMPAVA